MKRATVSCIHAIAGITAFLLIITFFSTSLACELSGDLASTILVKKYIFMAMWAMVILMPIAALTGKKLAGNSKSATVEKKRKRMLWIAPNGVILLLFASFLYYKVSQKQFDEAFYAVQTAKLVVWSINILLLGFMIRDGFGLTGRFKG